MSIVASVETWSGKSRNDENFPVGSILVNRAVRPHVHAFYAFARNADDIADSPALAPDDKIARLLTMQKVLLGQTEAGSPSAILLRDSLEETNVTSRHALDLLSAFRQDAVKRRYASWDELTDYCRRSAMPVGRHVLDLHDEDPASYGPSDPLCAALQVLNHLQDCGRDLRDLDRSYLPADWLAEEGVGVQDALASAAPPGLRRVFDRMLDATDALNLAAAPLPRAVRSRRLRLETAIICGLSRRLAGRLRRADPVAARVKLRRFDVAGAVLRSLAA